MRSTGQDGGPAYPTPLDGDWVEGMTVRDRFAEKAMQALLARWPLEQDWLDAPAERILDLGVASYAIADGLIKARSVT